MNFKQECKKLKLSKIGCFLLVSGCLTKHRKIRLLHPLSLLLTPLVLLYIVVDNFENIKNELKNYFVIL